MPKQSHANRRRLLLEVARLRHENKLTKTQISHRLRVSTTQVARLLQEAENEQIVQFIVVPPDIEKPALELERKYPFLRKVIVVPRVEDASYQQQILGAAAAKYFEEQVAPGMKVGIGGGQTVYQMIKQLRERKRGIRIYPTAIIGRGPTITHIDPTILVTLLWAKSGREPSSAYTATVPPTNRGARWDDVIRHYDKFKAWPGVKEVVNGMQSVDIVFTSIGSVFADRAYRRSTGYDTIKMLGAIGISEGDLRDAQVVGDINYCFFDANGKSRKRWSPFPSLDIKSLSKIVESGSTKRVVVVVGQYKIRALRAALEGQLCNVLITDDAAAHELLN